MTIKEYIKNHPEIEFTFKYAPEPLTHWGDKRYWRCTFSKPIKNTHLRGYACESYEQLINAIVNERD